MKDLIKLLFGKIKNGNGFKIKFTDKDLAGIKCYKIKELKASIQEKKNNIEIPEVRGIYFVGQVDKAKSLPVLEKSSMPKSKARAKWYGKDVLERVLKESQDKRILYIGKTDAKKGLKERISAYIRYINKANKVTGAHNGGRSIWQLKGADALDFCWIPMEKITDDPGIKAEDIEKALIGAYWELYRNYPFANRRL
ncbi:MAG: hypothetical protein M0P13_10260 [Fibrobacteraceae bacterium]|nr:hypothetical protein [Fibrobacteraceae bacterium]